MKRTPRTRLRPHPRPAPPLRMFAAPELGVAVFGALICRLHCDWFYRQGRVLQASAWSAGLRHCVALVLPTAVMGLSLPFLVRAMARETAPAAFRPCGPDPEQDDGRNRCALLQIM